MCREDLSGLSPVDAAHRRFRCELRTHAFAFVVVGLPGACGIDGFHWDRHVAVVQTQRLDLGDRARSRCSLVERSDHR